VHREKKLEVLMPKEAMLPAMSPRQCGSQQTGRWGDKNAVVPGSRDRRDGIVQVEQSRCVRTLAGSAAPHWLLLSLL
jgi:hypothetical protein